MTQRAVQGLQHGPLGLGDRPGDIAVHHREAGERRKPAADESAGHVEVGVRHTVQVGPEGDAVGVETAVTSGCARHFEAPGQALGVGAEGEHHPVGVHRGNGDHLRSRGRHFHRHLG